MNIAPIGIFVSWHPLARLIEYVTEMAGQQGFYIITILVGLGFHMFVTLFFAYWFSHARIRSRFSRICRRLC